MTVEEVLTEAAGLCRKYHAKEIILYGSRAKGTALKKSDIDIAVSGVKDFEGLAEEMDLIPTLYKIDLLDLDSCRNQFILEDIRQYGRKIREKISIV